MAADTFQIKRGATAAVNAYLPASGELVLDTTLTQLHVGDGVTVGGTVVGTPTSAFMASLLDDVSAATALLTLGAAPLASPVFTGVPEAPTATPGTNTTQLSTTGFVEAVRVALVAADALKAPLASPALTGIPTSPTPAVATNTTQIATAAMVQAEISNKRAWTSYTPTITATSGAFTTTSATGTYMVAFGVCHYQVVITVTTVGTGVKPRFTLPFTALTGNTAFGLAREGALNNKVGVAVPISTTVMQCVDYINGDLCTGNGSSIAINGSYPIA